MATAFDVPQAPTVRFQRESGYVEFSSPGHDQIRTSLICCGLTIATEVCSMRTFERMIRKVNRERRRSKKYVVNSNSNSN